MGKDNINWTSVVETPDIEMDSAPSLEGLVERLRPDAATTTLSAQIMHRIREDLFTGRLTAGERLGTEASLAEHYGVSRITIRDSLRSLLATGLIEVKVGIKGGIFVAQGNTDRLAETLAIQLMLIGMNTAEVMDTQIAIEVMAAGLAATNADADDLAGLKEAAQAVAHNLNDPQAFTAAAMAFHRAIVEASHNRMLLAQFDALNHMLWPLYMRGASSLDVARRAMAFQSALIGCIEARSPGAARNLVYERLQMVRSRQLGDLAVPQAGPNK